MFRSLFRSVKRRPGTFRPAVLHLDERVAPAVVGTLYAAGGYLIYSGTAANNVVTVSGTDAAFTINDAAGTISSTVPGFVGGGNTVTGILPPTITGIIINGNAGVDSVAVPGLAISRTFQVGADLIAVPGALQSGKLTFQADAGGQITLGGSLDSTGGVAKGDLNLYGPVYVGPGPHAVTADGAITVTGAVTGSGGLAINAAGSAGNVTFVSTVTLDGDLTVGSFGIPGAGAVNAAKAVTVGGAIDVTAGRDAAFTGAAAVAMTVHAPHTSLNGTVVVTGGLTIAGGSVDDQADVTAATVGMTGGLGAANVFRLNGPITATAGDITVDNTLDTKASAVTITGQMTAAGTTRLIGSATAGDSFSVVPSTTSTFTFTFGSGANTLVVNTDPANILSAPADFSSPILFTPMSGFLPWTKTAGGNVTVFA